MSKIRIGIQQEPLDEKVVKEISEWCKHPESGAVITFEGTTRNYFEDKTVVELSYECYQEMALLEMMKICEEALASFNELQKVAFIHRIGVVKIAECSVICAVSCKHRKQAFEACEWMMNELKARVPIWKKEIYQGKSKKDGVWKENVEAFKGV
jgi:molybdopterin synthase catalytic subunit